MIGILFLSGVCAVMFTVTARRKGYVSPRFWIFPLVLGVTITGASLIMERLARLVITDEKSLFLLAYPLLVQALAVLVFLILISKAWKQIKALPQKEP